MSRVSKTSNPVRASSAPNCDSSLEWTTPAYDDLGRAVSITTPDSAVVTTAYSLATSGSQIGTTVTVTDQAGKLRRSITNGIGQLTRVDEPNASNQLRAVDNPNQYTAYSYDLLNNLTTVNQGVQTRTFTYNSLSRLLSATNPESGTINYSYDSNGNLTSKIDARTITTTYTYDAFNRVVQRSYNDSPQTPTVNYFYDNLTNAKGKLIKVENAYSKTEYQTFDILGRITQSQQTTDGTAYNPMTYTYNLSGGLVEQKYPSGRIVKTSIDDDGMLRKVESKKDANDIWRGYANNFKYTAAGAVESMQLGNGKFENTQFNNRLQPIQIGLGSSASTQNFLKLNYDYGTTDNNGNVRSQVITVPTIGATTGFVATQNYTYDSLKRINDATENIAGQTPPNWKQTFTYDRYGNRNFDEANTTQPVSFANPDVTNPTVGASNNRFAAGQGYSYDASGNTTADALARTFVYDAENKQIEVIENSISIGKYYYDGDGKRIKKISANETVIFIYDASGKLVAEYANQTSQTPKISYLTNDHLGSPRITTDELGQVISRRDFMPFGEEIYRPNYDSDSVRQKFTGYERDNETDLDFAQARYFNSGFGRFSSPDDFLNDTQQELPQKWNLYVYVSNNPLRYKDPTGNIQENEDGTIKTKDRKANGTTEIKKGDKIYSKYAVITGKDGKSYALIGEVKPVYIFADDGTKIKATVGVGELKMVEDKTYTQEEWDKAELKDYDKPGSTHSADCHGVTFAKGQVWINDGKVNKILKGDNYSLTTTPQENDVGIYAKEVTSKGKVKGINHSVTVSERDEEGAVTQVISKGGTNPVKQLPPGPGANSAWERTNVKLFYFTKRTKQ